MTARVAVWDWPVRIVHWGLVVLIPWSWWTAENDMLDKHRASGLMILTLLLFRLIWGFAGSPTARFAGFVRAPAAVLAYLRGAPHNGFGHNPLGGWSVLAMFAALVGQVSLGLFAVDIDGLESGPLSRFVSFETGRAAAELHELLFNGILALVALHIAAILYYLIRRRTNLITPMLTGRTDAPPNDLVATVRTNWLRAILTLTASMAVVSAIAKELRF